VGTRRPSGDAWITRTKIKPQISCAVGAGVRSRVPLDNSRIRRHSRGGNKIVSTSVAEAWPFFLADPNRKELVEMSRSVLYLRRTVNNNPQ
jgi:hypothetical protein